MASLSLDEKERESHFDFTNVDIKDVSIVGEGLSGPSISSDGFFYFVKLKKNNPKTFFKVDAEGIISLEFKNKERFAIKWWAHQHQYPQTKATDSLTPDT